MTSTCSKWATLPCKGVRIGFVVVVAMAAFTGCPGDSTRYASTVDGCRDDVYNACVASGCGCLNNACTPTSGNTCSNGAYHAKVDGCDTAHRSTCLNQGCGCLNNMCSGGACVSNPFATTGYYYKYDGCSGTEREGCAQSGRACLNGRCSAPVAGQMLYDGCTDVERRTASFFGCGCLNGSVNCPQDPNIERPTDGCTPQQREDCSKIACGCKAGQCYRGPKCDANGNPIAVKPIVEISSPANNTVIDVPHMVPIEATPADNLSIPYEGTAGHKVSKVEFYINGVLKATDTSPPFGYYEWLVNSTTQATNTIYVKAYNDQGGVEPHQSQTVTVTNSITSSVLPTNAQVHIVPDPTSSEAGPLPAPSLGPTPTFTADYLPNPPTQMQKVDVYKPAPTHSGPRPVLVYLHGGGFGGGCEPGVSCEDPLERRNTSLNGAPVVKVPAQVFSYLNQGWAVVSVEYRLLNAFKYPKALHDVKTAIRWIKVNAVTHGFDASRIVLSGVSAGANLAALAGMSASANALEPPDLPPAYTAPGIDSKVKGLIIWQGPDFVTQRQYDSPVLDELGFYLDCHFKPSAVLPLHPACTAQQIDEASALHYVNANSPPVYLAYSPYDFIVPPTNGVAIAKRHIALGQGAKVWFDLTDRIANDPEAPQRGHSVEWAGINLTSLNQFMTQMGS